MAIQLFFKRIQKLVCCMNGSRITIVIGNEFSQFMTGRDAVVHDSNRQIQCNHIYIFHHNIVFCHIKIHFVDNLIHDTFIHILILEESVSTCIVIPVLRKQMIQDNSSFSFIFLKLNMITVPGKNNMRIGQNIFSAKCM